MNALAHMHVYAYNLHFHLHAFGPNIAMHMHVNVCMQTAFNSMRATHYIFVRVLVLSQFFEHVY